MRRFKRSVSESTKRQVAAKYSWKCAVCNEMLESTFQVDHIVPLWKGGTNEIDNLQPLCVNHHAQKTQEEANERNKLRRAQRGRMRPYVECIGCGVIFSPYFSHRCL